MSPPVQAQPRPPGDAAVNLLTGRVVVGQLEVLGHAGQRLDGDSLDL
eukprot:CAMPEP_0183461036 /NCGR_PEP_ID=MMETSP0370-20130417/138855_1 /TAXON_ID=268820 /ORGANISM="Peridinium aciculiferum, Strain PAER-2" /LENGTH=46 /DNA_ID= /DNA_START= /DNA_END= /DNA_ORIENTATION=